MFEHLQVVVGIPVSRRPNELSNRWDCTTCCRALFMLDMNVISYKKSTPPNDKWSVSMPKVDTHDALGRTGEWDHVLIVCPLKVHGDELQCFEPASFKMLNMFMHPTRVHDSVALSRLGRG